MLSSGPRSWRHRVQDILGAIHRIRSYTAGMNMELFEADLKTVDAVERNLILIGEAAGRIPENIARRFSAVPWRKMQDMRNVVVHQYWGVDLERLWGTIQNDLPPLVPLLEHVLEETTE
jgi:uncharacterized protein with HEPN domain